MSTRFKLVAEWEAGMTKSLGHHDTMESAERRITEIDNDPDGRLSDEYVGAEMVLTEIATGKQWFYSDMWEEVA